MCNCAWLVVVEVEVEIIIIIIMLSIPIPIRIIMVEVTVKTAVKKACNCECLYEPIWAKLRNLIEFDLSVALEFLVIMGKTKGKESFVCIF